MHQIVDAPGLRDLERLQLVLEYLPDERLMQRLELMRQLVPPASTYTRLLRKLMELSEEVEANGR